MQRQYYLVWDYAITKEDFARILAGEHKIGKLDQDWAVTRLLEYGGYWDIIDLLGYQKLVENWPKWRNRVRSESRKRGLIFSPSGYRSTDPCY